MDTEQGGQIEEVEAEAGFEATASEKANWARAVIAGKSILEAVSGKLAFSQSARVARAAAYLDDRATRDSVLRGLALSGQNDRADEILRYYATLAASDAIEKGDARVILAMLPKSPGKARKAPEDAPELPTGGRSLK